MTQNFPDWLIDMPEYKLTWQQVQTDGLTILHNVNHVRHYEILKMDDGSYVAAIGDSISYSFDDPFDAMTFAQEYEFHCVIRAKFEQEQLDRFLNKTQIAYWQPIDQLNPSEIDTENVSVNILGNDGSVYVGCFYSRTDSVWKYEDFDPVQGDWCYFPVPEPIAFVLIEGGRAAKARLET